jgi:hypothetical protein
MEETQEMNNPLRTGRALPATGDTVTARTSLRIALVATASVATLVSLPGWLRGLEAAPTQRLVHDRIPARTTAMETSGLAAPPAQHEVAAYGVLAEALAKRYRVSRESLERFVQLAYAAGRSTKIDPLLILAVMAVESNFNPIAESVMGAKGLMQIIPEYHQDKLRSPGGGQVNVLDPEVNIIAGAKVLREYATRTGNDLVAALRLYGGIGSDLENPYPGRVLSEWRRLEQILRRVQHGERAVGSA